MIWLMITTRTRAAVHRSGDRQGRAALSDALTGVPAPTKGFFTASLTPLPVTLR